MNQNVLQKIIFIDEFCTWFHTKFYIEKSSSGVSRLKNTRLPNQILKPKFYTIFCLFWNENILTNQNIETEELIYLIF